MGDRLETDVAGAEGMGWDSLLVLSGASTLADLMHLPHAPTYLGRDVSSLLDDRPAGRFREATASDLPGLRVLLEEASLGAAGVEHRLTQTLVAPARSPRRGLVASACLLDFGEGLGLLRSVAVDPEARGWGLGTLAVAAALRAARLSGSVDRLPVHRGRRAILRAFGLREDGSKAASLFGGGQPSGPGGVRRDGRRDDAPTLIAPPLTSPRGAAVRIPHRIPCGP